MFCSCQYKYFIYCIQYFVIRVPPDIPAVSIDHPYSIPSTSVEMRPKPCRIGRNSVSVISGEEVNLCEAVEGEAVEFGCSVNLLTSSYKVVGTAMTMSGTSLHGHDLPAGYVKVGHTSNQSCSFLANFGN